MLNCFHASCSIPFHVGNRAFFMADANQYVADEVQPDLLKMEYSIKMEFDKCRIENSEMCIRDRSDIDPDWQNWTTKQYQEALNHPIAQKGFDSDFNGMQWADVCVMVLPLSLIHI